MVALGVEKSTPTLTPMKMESLMMCTDMKIHKRIWFDVETTGLNPKEHEIHELSMLYEEDGKVIEKRTWYIKPTRFYTIDENALAICNKSIEDLKKYSERRYVYQNVKSFLMKYISCYDRLDKATLCGYNIIAFDVPFLEAFFNSEFDKYMFSFFNHYYVDVYAYFNILEDMGFIPFNKQNRKLSSLCEHYDIVLNAHESLSDIEATRNIYYQLKGVCFGS